jgi:uncharacterized membrane protein YbhN (UPF0104 family)
MVNYAAPIGLAVPTRAALTMRDLGLSAGQSGAVVAWEAALDLLMLLVMSIAWLALGGAVFMPAMGWDARLASLGVAVLIFVVVLLVALSRNARMKAMLVRFLHRTIVGPKQEPALALAAVGLTVAFWGIQSRVMAELLTIFGVLPTTSLVLGVMGLPVLIGMLSPVPGGAGIREALMVAAAGLEGAPGAPVLLAAVTYRLALFAITPLVWGLIRLARAAKR